VAEPLGEALGLRFSEGVQGFSRLALEDEAAVVGGLTVAREDE
jgi:hypothetical protein